MRPGVGAPLRPRLTAVSLSDEQWAIVARTLAKAGTQEAKRALSSIQRQTQRKKWATIEAQEGDA